MFHKARARARALAIEEAHTFGVLPASSIRELCKPIRALRFSAAEIARRYVASRRIDTRDDIVRRRLLSRDLLDKADSISFSNFGRSSMGIFKEIDRQGLAVSRNYR